MENRDNTVFHRLVSLEGNHSEMLQKNFEAHKDQDDSAGQFRFRFEFQAEHISDLHADDAEKERGHTCLLYTSRCV